MKMRHSLLATAALLSMATASQAVELGGYFRTGPGTKGADKCYGANFDGGTYRLGNECNTYGEFELSQKAKAGGVDYKVLFMTNFYRPGSDVGDGDQKLKLNQLYVEGTGFDVAPNLNFWVGRRFYLRDDVHMVDHKFNNLSGEGAGVDGIAVGDAKLALAVFRTNENIFDPTDPYSGDAIGRAPNSGTRLNADLAGIVSNPGGSLRLTATATRFGGDDGENGYGLSAQHKQAGLFGSNVGNTLWVQYQQGSANFSGGFGRATDGSSSKGWRIADSVTLLKGSRYSFETLAMVGKQGDSGNKLKFATLGGRLAYAFTNNFKLQGEVGVSRSKLEDGETQQLTKFTIAPTLTVGPAYFDRPELRLYYTHAMWNNAYRDANPVYGNDKNGDSVGIQVEIWF